MNLLSRAGRNVGGIQQFFFVESRQILRDPQPVTDVLDNALVVQQIPLITGALWYQAIVTKHTLNFKEKAEQTKFGTRYIQEFTGIASRQRPEMASIFTRFTQDKYCIVFLDRNGYLRLIGGRDHGLLCTTESDSGTAPVDRNHISFMFKGVSGHPSYFYSGSLYSHLAPIDEVPDFGDQTVVARSLEDGITIRILEP